MTERLGTRIGRTERRVKTCESFRLQAILAPLERGQQSCPLLGVESDGPARADRLEPLANRLRSLNEGKLLEQYVALVPRDLDDLARDVDAYATRSARSSATVMYRVAHRAPELANALRESVICVARPVLEEFDQGEHLARLKDIDRSAPADSVHLGGDRLRRGRLQCARLEFLADAPRHFDLSASDVEVDAVEALRHRRDASA